MPLEYHQAGDCSMLTSGLRDFESVLNISLSIESGSDDYINKNAASILQKLHDRSRVQIWCLPPGRILFQFLKFIDTVEPRNSHTRIVTLFGLTKMWLFWYVNSQAGVQKSNPQAGGSPLLATSGKRPSRFSKFTSPFLQVKTISLFSNRKKFREIPINHHKCSDKVPTKITALLPILK